MGFPRLKHALVLLAILAVTAAARPQTPRQKISVQQRMIVLEGDASTLRVNELYKVLNPSRSGRTKAPAQPRLEIYLPPGAVVAQAAARSDGTKAVKVDLVPLAEKNRFAFGYPVEPGQTQFTVTYNLPYSGQFKIDPRITAPTAQLMVIAPDTMALVPESNSALLPANDPQLKNVIVYVASEVTPEANLAFAVQGSGSLGHSQKQEAPAATARGKPPEASRSGESTGVRDQSSSGAAPVKWIFLAVLLLFLAAGATYVYSVNQAAPSAPLAASPPSLLSDIKEEMFQLESDRLQGKLSPEEYEAAKAALDKTMQKIL